MSSEIALTITDATLISLISGLVIPFLTGLATRIDSTKARYAGVAAALSVIVGALSSLVLGGTVELKSLGVAVLVAFASKELAYRGLWKPWGMLGTGDNAGTVNRAATGVF